MCMTSATLFKTLESNFSSRFFNMLIGISFFVFNLIYIFKLMLSQIITINFIVLKINLIYYGGFVVFAIISGIFFCYFFKSEAENDYDDEKSIEFFDKNPPSESDKINKDNSYAYAVNAGLALFFALYYPILIGVNKTFDFFIDQYTMLLQASLFFFLGILTMFVEPIIIFILNSLICFIDSILTLKFQEEDWNKNKFNFLCNLKRFVICIPIIQFFLISIGVRSKVHKTNCLFSLFIITLISYTAYYTNEVIILVFNPSKLIDKEFCIRSSFFSIISVVIGVSMFFYKKNENNINLSNIGKLKIDGPDESTNSC